MSIPSCSSRRELALTIPHILDSIAQDLSLQDIRNCVYTCKVFKNAFQPYVYRSLSITRDFQYKAFEKLIGNSTGQGQASVENQSIVRNIRKLSSDYCTIWGLFLDKKDQDEDVVERTSASDAQVEDEMTLDSCSKSGGDQTAKQRPQQFVLRTPFSNLTVLHAAATGKTTTQSHPDCTSQLLDLIEGSPNLWELEILKFCNDSRPQDLDRLSGIIRGHQSLKRVALRFRNVIKMDVLLWSCWRLESLKIWGAMEAGNDFGPKELEAWIERYSPKDALYDEDGRPASVSDTVERLFPLKEFYLNTTQDFVLMAFLRRCRSLRRLQMPRMYTSQSFLAMAACIKENLNEIEHLDMRNQDPTGGSISEEAAILSACKPTLKSLTLRESLVPKLEMMRVINTELAPNLEQLDLTGCSFISGRIMQSFLASCPNLREFRALCDNEDSILDLWSVRTTKAKDPSIEACNVEYAENWACAGLEMLRLQF
ncbi:hypothetical protein BGZ94_009196, partial [Podila epigama]